MSGAELAALDSDSALRAMHAAVSQAHEEAKAIRGGGRA
jgi:hypothetical protein